MVTSCFFCQNLLSDYIEGVLPSVRHEELKKHLGGCQDCSGVHGDLMSTLEVLHGLPSQPISHEMALRITEASHAGKTQFFSRARLSQWLLFLSLPVLMFASVAITFPKLFPWLARFRSVRDDTHFVRYFPLLQGAQEILEEQSGWLHMREPFMRSVWEEGGLSPEEFEKSFQVKGAGAPKGETK